MAGKDIRARAWTLVIYPESAPNNWRDILDGFHIPWVESPCHDKDVNPDGSVKKAHWHILLLFEGKKSYEQVKEIADSLNAPIPQRVKSVKGMVRYFVHLDNPEKYQYAKSDIVTHGGAEIDQYFAMSASDKDQVLKDITAFIHKNHVTNLMSLQLYVMETGKDDWFTVIARQSTVYLKTVLDAEWHLEQAKMYQDQAKKLDNPRSKADLAEEMSEKGYKQKEIADTLGVSVRTVKRYLSDEM